MRKVWTACALVLAVAAASLGFAAQETIDFQAEPAGKLLSSVYGSGGSGPVGVLGTNPKLAPGTNAAVVFDSAAPPGIDFDLGSPNETCPTPGPGIGAGGEVGQPYENCVARGHVLIVNETVTDSNGDGIADFPNDVDVLGAKLEFDFAAIAPVTIHGITLFDIEADEPVATVELYGATSNLLASFNLPQVGDNGVGEIGLGPTAGVHRVVVTLNGSGAIDDLVFETQSVCGDGILDPGEECDDGNTVDGDGCSSTCTTESACGDGILDPGEECDDGNTVDGDGCSSTCEVEDTGGQGCTPGYWKQPQHFDSWVGYAPTDSFDAVFGVDGTGNPSLLDALKNGGGGESALQRHAVAALLNASSGVDFLFTPAEVIAHVQHAYASGDFEGVKDLFAGQNELGCPLN